ncbi:hypothetical protein HNR42_000001, partial [Deinobacterium chartae]|nr:hypothetical protein [Deinobacterium chartae]
MSQRSQSVVPGLAERPLHRAKYVKPDGRQLWLYARHPLHVTDIPSPSPEPVTA